MKRIIFTLLIAFVSFQMASAQGLLQGDANQKVNKMIQKKSDKMAGELGLTTKQQIEVKNKLEEFFLKRQELIKQSSDGMDKKDLKKRLAVFKSVQIAEFRDILTGPQFSKYKKMLTNNPKKLKAKNSK